MYEFSEKLLEGTISLSTIKSSYTLLGQSEMTSEWGPFNQPKSAHIPLTVPGNLYTACQWSGIDLKALWVSKTQSRDDQVIPHLSDPDQKNRFPYALCCSEI